MKKEYIFTKAILKPLLEANVKDVYYSDDTYWSFKVSEELIKVVKDIL